MRSKLGIISFVVALATFFSISIDFNFLSDVEGLYEYTDYIPTIGAIIAILIGLISLIKEKKQGLYYIFLVLAFLISLFILLGENLEKLT